jgi:lipopolysaccharide export system permease protein
VKILLRYLIKELTVPLALWLAFLFLLLFVMQFLRATEVLLGSAVTWGDLGRLMLYLTPHFLVMAIPIAFLLALLLGFGRVAEDRELIAMHALGVSPAQLLLIALVMASVLGALMLGLSSGPEPRGLSAVKGLINEVIKKNIAGDVKPGVFYEDLTNLTVYAERVGQGERGWGNVLLHDDRDPDAPLLVLAREGRVYAAGQGEALRLALEAGEVHRANRSTTDYSVVEFQRADINVGVQERIVRKNRFRSPREELTPSELLLAAQQEEAAGRDGRPYLIAYHSRFGQSLVPLAFALLGTPLAMSRRGGGRTRGLLFTVAGYVGYYVLARLFENLAAQERLPIALAAYLPAALIAAVGMWRMAVTTRSGAMR